jgi:hypothetical protein
MFKPRPSVSPLIIILGFTLLLLSADKTARAQDYVPATQGFDTQIKVWTSGGNTYAKVVLTFPTGGWRVDWGQVTKSGNNFTAEARVERYNGPTTQAITYKENTYNLGALEPGSYTFTFKSFGVAMKSVQFDPAQVIEHWEPATLPDYRVGVRMMTFTGGLINIKVELYFPDTGYSVLDWGQIVRSGNELSVNIQAQRWTGESEARTVLVDHDYNSLTLQPGAYSLTIKISGTTVKTQPFSISEPATPAVRLLTEENSERAIALDSVTWLRVFPIVSTLNFSQDRRTRIVLFLSGAELSAAEASALTAQAEDAEHTVYPLTIEYVGKVPGFDWLTQVIVRPPEGLKSGGDVWVSITARGALSNRAVVSLKP